MAHINGKPTVLFGTFNAKEQTYKRRIVAFIYTENFNIVTFKMIPLRLKTLHV